jgi:hypothetical protein
MKQDNVKSVELDVLESKDPSTYYYIYKKEKNENENKRDKIKNKIDELNQQQKQQEKIIKQNKGVTSNRVVINAFKRLKEIVNANKFFEKSLKYIENTIEFASDKMKATKKQYYINKAIKDQNATIRSRAENNNIFKLYTLKFTDVKWSLENFQKMGQKTYKHFNKLLKKNKNIILNFDGYVDWKSKKHGENKMNLQLMNMNSFKLDMSNKKTIKNSINRAIKAVFDKNMAEVENCSKASDDQITITKMETMNITFKEMTTDFGGRSLIMPESYNEFIFNPNSESDCIFEVLKHSEIKLNKPIGVIRDELKKTYNAMIETKHLETIAQKYVNEPIQIRIYKFKENKISTECTKYPRKVEGEHKIINVLLHLNHYMHLTNIKEARKVAKGDEFKEVPKEVKPELKRNESDNLPVQFETYKPKQIIEKESKDKKEIKTPKVKAENPEEETKKEERIKEYEIDVYFYDLETHLNENKDHIPYNVGVGKYKDVANGKIEQALNGAKVFYGYDCVKKFVEYIKNEVEKINKINERSRNNYVLTRLNGNKRYYEYKYRVETLNKNTKSYKKDKEALDNKLKQYKISKPEEMEKFGEYDKYRISKELMIKMSKSYDLFDKSIVMIKVRNYPEAEQLDKNLYEQFTSKKNYDKQYDSWEQYNCMWIEETIWEMETLINKEKNNENKRVLTVKFNKFKELAYEQYSKQYPETTLIEKPKNKRNLEKELQKVNPLTKNKNKKVLKFYAHNSARYDNYLILNELEKITNVVKSSGLLMIEAFDGRVQFLDFYRHCNSSLSQLCTDFKVGEEFSKTSFPHDFINEKKDINYNGPIPEAKYWPEKKIPKYYEKETFNMKEISIHYQKLDVIALARVYKQYCGAIFSFTGLNPAKYLTNASFGYDYVMRKVAGKTSNFEIIKNLEIDNFIRKSIRGGRNFVQKSYFESKQYKKIKKMIVKVPQKVLEEYYNQIDDYLVDFDANSLYPSAMALFKYPIGIPKVVKDEAEIKKIQDQLNNLTYENLCILKCDVTFEKKNYCLSLLGTKEYEEKQMSEKQLKELTEEQLQAKIFKTNENKNLYKRADQLKYTFNDKFGEYFTSVDLEEAIKYNSAKITKIYDVLEWTEKDYILKDAIEPLYNKRKEDKKSALGASLKIIMNSSYGTMIKRLVDEYFKITMSNEEFEEFIINNELKGFSLINDETILMQLKQVISEDSIKHPSFLGTFILSYSKRIMNHAIHAFNGFNSWDDTFFYTDTDSLNIHVKQFNELKDKKVKYPGLEHEINIVGGGMGQLHDDIDCVAEGKIIRAIYIRPKCYLLEVIGKALNDEEDKGIRKGDIVIKYHIRSKGIASRTLEEFTEEELVAQFEKLFKGESIKYEIKNLFERKWQDKFDFQGVRSVDKEKEINKTKWTGRVYDQSNHYWYPIGYNNPK